MRKLDLNQLKFWAIQYKSEAAAMAYLEVKTGLGFYTLRRIFQGKREPKVFEYQALCEATGLKMDDLFPVSKQEKIA